VTAPAIPDGLEPLAVWDARDPLNCQPDVPRYLESTEWAKAHIERVNDTYRAEFYLVDGPFAVVHRYSADDTGRRLLLAGDGELATEEPVVQMLDELPPAHLLETR
jgi:hypothetical protein